jgi:hypothetical protein
VFASLLDADRGGSFAIRPEAAVRVKQLYMPDTNVLVTRLLGADSVAEVVDFMVPRPAGGPLTPAGPLLVHRCALLPVLACLADEWQQAVDQGPGDQDLTVVTRTIEQPAGPP